MSLQVLLPEVDASWFLRESESNVSAEGGIDAVPAELLSRAGASALGRRILARQLVAQGFTHLLAPSADRSVAAAAATWPAPRLAGLVRDLGTLAFAPIIRSEVRREPVRRLKRALGKNYMLPLDLSIWDGKVSKSVSSALKAAFDDAIHIAGDDDAAILDALDLQGRGELHAWALQRDGALADLVRLRYARAALPSAHLPEKPVLFLYSHHDVRGDKVIRS